MQEPFPAKHGHSSWEGQLAVGTFKVNAFQKGWGIFSHWEIIIRQYGGVVHILIDCANKNDHYECIKAINDIFHSLMDGLKGLSKKYL